MPFSRYLAKFLFTLLCILNFHFTSAQKNFVAGYIIQRGDTIRGFVDYRNWRINPEIISFKSSVGEAPATYSPLQIDGFSAMDEIYESAIVKTEVSGDPVESGFQPNGGSPVLEADTVFLQALITGDKSLYFAVNRLGKDQLYIRRGDVFDLLIYKRYMLEIEGNQGIAENSQYRAQLRDYLGECTDLRFRIGKLTYGPRSMANLFGAYYECTGSKVAFQKKIERTIVEIGFVGGMALTSLKITEIEYLEKARMDASIDAMPGFFFEILPPRNLRKWSLYNEISYSAYKVRGDYRDSYPVLIDLAATDYTSHIGMAYLKMTNLVRLKYPVGTGFVFANVGISNAFSIRETNSLKKVTVTPSGERVSNEKALADIRKYEQGVAFGVGARRGHLSLELRHERGNGMSPFAAVTSTTKRFIFVAGYRL